MNHTVPTTHLSVLSGPQDGDVGLIANELDHKWVVEGRDGLERLLCDLLAQPSRGKSTLDLIGHSTSDRSLLRLGDFVIDAGKHSVTGFFRGLADADVFTRLEICAIRLLGCETAVTAYGRATIRTLSEITGLEVLALRQTMRLADFDARGFRAESQHALISSRDDLGEIAPIPLVLGNPVRRTLDLDSLRASPLGVKPWTQRIATTETAAAILRLIRRNHGAYMSSLDPVPTTEVCLPSAVKPTWYCHLEIVLDASFVRVQLDELGPGVVFPVSEPAELREILKELPRL